MGSSGEPWPRWYTCGVIMTWPYAHHAAPYGWLQRNTDRVSMSVRDDGSLRAALSSFESPSDQQQWARSSPPKFSEPDVRNASVDGARLLQFATQTYPLVKVLRHFYKVSSGHAAMVHYVDGSWPFVRRNHDSSTAAVIANR